LFSNYEFITNESTIESVISDAKKCKYIGFDTENKGGLDVLCDGVKLLLFQFEINDKAFVFDARKVDISRFKDVLENREIIKVIQNAKYDYKLLRHLYDIHIRGIYDTYIAEALLEAGLQSKKSLEELVLKYNNVKIDKQTVETFFDFADDEEFTDEQIRYSATDVLVLSEIRINQQRRLNQYTLNQTADLEFLLVEPVAEMELTGITLDAERWKSSLKDTTKSLFEYNCKLMSVLPDPPPPPPKPLRFKKDGTPYKTNDVVKPPPVLNLDSWQQLIVAFKSIGIDLREADKHTKKGPTNSSTIKFAKSLYRDDEVKVETLNNLLKYREYNQIHKTFGDNLLEQIHEDGKIHATFNQNRTKSGRFSSSNPNLQNIKKKGRDGKILRSCFIPSYGNKFVMADYSQAELRIAAELSNDKTMIDILCDPYGDIHTSTASLMFGIPVDLVTYEQRRAAKTLNFGIIYGMSGYTLADSLGCKLDEALDLLERYNKTYHTLMGWLERESKKSLNRGFSVTIGKRIRWYPPLIRKNYETEKEYKRAVSFYGRIGKNHPIQGTSADMLKLSIALLYFPLLKYNAKIVNNIHDELCVEAPADVIIDVAKLVKEKMIRAGHQYIKKVPPLADVKIRDWWFADDGIDDDENGQQLWLIPPQY